MVEVNQSICFENHIAFTANDFDQVEDLLLRHQVPFWKQRLEKVGATQLFFRDPDGNVIEVGSCTVPVGSTNCRANSLA
jgi:hypothetical protein